MLCQFMASIPGKGFIEFVWDSVGMFDQRIDDGFSAPVGYLCKHHIARVTLNQGHDEAMLGTTNQVTFPVTGDGAILHRSRSFADRDRILDLSAWVFAFKRMS